MEDQILSTLLLHRANDIKHAIKTILAMSLVDIR